MPRDYCVRQVSSRDPSGGNDDGAFAAWAFDGGIVLADLEGPGTVLRIWTREPSGTLSVYVDEMSAPLFKIPFEKLFTDYLEAFSTPLSGEAGGGYYSYAPIPYQDRCCLVLYEAEEDFRYHVTYAAFPPETMVTPLNLKLGDDELAFFRQWRNEWGKIPKLRFHDLDTEELYTTERTVWGSEGAQLWHVDGPGTVTELEMVFSSVDPEILDHVWLAFYWNGAAEASVYAPASEFFGGAGMAQGDYAGVALGKQGDRLWCRFPMPFASRARLRIQNNSDAVVDIRYNITWRPGPIGDARYFHAAYNKDVTEKDIPYTALDVSGSGHFVGCTVIAKGGTGFDFLEGDETLLVDGEPIAGYLGTGTDDYFNAGPGFNQGLFSAATHGCTAKSGIAPVHIAAYRSHVTDVVPFRESAQFLLEHGPQNSQSDVTYSSVAYWYLSTPQPVVFVEEEPAPSAEEADGGEEAEPSDAEADADEEAQASEEPGGED